MGKTSKKPPHRDAVIFHPPWESDVAQTMPPVPLRPWKEHGHNTLRYALVGLLLGGIAGCTSLLANIIGSVLWPSLTGEPQHPLRLIQVYLTFPLGEKALQLESGAVLAVGCLLYLATGMLYGTLFQLVLSYLFPRARFTARIAICCVLAVAIWALNFYAVLVWLQPKLLGGSWIVELIPAWVSAATHLVFGATMAILYPLGKHDQPPAGQRSR